MAGRISTPKPREDGTVDLRVKLSAETAAKLNEVAAERIVGVQLLVRLAIDEFVARLIPISETELLRPVGEQVQPAEVHQSRSDGKPVENPETIACA